MRRIDLYVLTADDPATVYQISTDNHATITARTLTNKALALAVSNDGKHLYVVVEPTSPATLRQLHVLDTTQSGMPDFNTAPLDLPNSSGSAVTLAVAPRRRGCSRWSRPAAMCCAGLPTSIRTPRPLHRTVVKNLGANVAGLTLSSDGKLAFVFGPGNQIQSLDLAAATVTPIGRAARRGEAFVDGAGQQHRAGHARRRRSNQSVPSSRSAAAGGDVDRQRQTRSPAGRARRRAGRTLGLRAGKDTDSFIQSVSLDALVQHLAVTPGAAFKIGDDSRQIVMTASGKRLYIPYVDDIAQPAAGGVAIVEVTEGSCAEILWRHLDGCPHCDLPDCVVLATIENYHLGDRIEEQTDPPADPAQDAQDKIARIDNRKGRRLLPSTEVLTELVECLLEHGVGGAGTQGLPGTPARRATKETRVTKGDKGDKGDSVTGPAGPKGDPGAGSGSRVSRELKR